MYSKQGKDEKDAAETLERAWSKLAVDPDLRFFLAQMLDWSGVLSPPSTNNAIETARLLGRMDAGHFLITEMEATQPYLFPLIMKDNVDHAQRQSNADEPDSSE